MRTNQTFERSIPLLFLLVTIVTYGLLLPFTGFYWDDWPFAWMAKYLGSQEFIPGAASSWRTGVTPLAAMDLRKARAVNPNESR